MILIVSGPSFSGKSKFISEKGAGIATIDLDNVEYLHSFVKKGLSPREGMTLHYNVDRMSEDGTSKVINALKAESTVKAVVLITPETELKERIFHFGTASGRSEKSYQGTRDALKTERRAVYKKWINFLQDAGIEPCFVESSGGKFKEISKNDIDTVLGREVTNTATPYRKSQIEKILSENDFGKYHRVELPYGLAAPGQDVWERFPLVFPSSLAGMSVLDIGCAQGAFSFEAERRGAKVLASDSNPARLKSAKAFSELLGSKVQFTDRDFLKGDVDETFDVVLALNVLHHVKDPVAALQKAAALARKYVILEFPSSKDPLYKDKKMKSLLGPHLFEEISLFGEVKLIPSPKEERVIAICSKSAIDPWPSANTAGARRAGIPRHETF